MRYYKLYKILFEDIDYRDVSLISKVAYGVYVDLLENSCDIEIDENGRKYIKDARKILIDELGISINTVTKVHKELVEAELIEEVWQGMNLPNRVYIKNYETIELEETNYPEFEYQKELDEMFKRREFTDFEIKDSQELILEIFGEFPFLEVSKILKKIDRNMFSNKDMKMIKLAMTWMTVMYADKEDYEDIIEIVDEDLLEEAIVETKKSGDLSAKAIILADYIYKISSQKLKS